MALERSVRTGRGAPWTMSGVIAALGRTDACSVAQVCIDCQRVWTAGYEIVEAQVHIGRRRS